jgi:hypothetical protein
MFVYVLLNCRNIEYGLREKGALIRGDILPSRGIVWLNVSPEAKVRGWANQTQPIHRPIDRKYVYNCISICYSLNMSVGLPVFSSIFSLPSKVMNICQQRRKLRLIDDNATYRHLKKLTCKVTLRRVFICLRPRTPYPPPPYTLYMYIVHTVYLFTQGRGRGES